MILIVDDDVQNSRMLGRVLEDRHECQVVTRADQALDAIKAQEVELVVLDIDLAGESGVDLAKHLLAASPDTAIVIVTGDDDLEIASAAREIGHGYVAKPFGEHEIRITVENALHRRELELHNRAMVAELRELNETKDALIGAVSHDLRDPLTAIAGLAALMEKHLERFSSAQIREFLEETVTAACEMTSMLQSLLDRDRASRGIIARAPTKLDELARRVVAALDPGDHHVHLECAAVSAEVDPVMVERIVDNLVRNALKHTPGDSNIWVSVAPTNGGTQIVVEDDGPGVGDDLQGAMFDRFRSGETEEGGSGVGLWLVEKFTRLHDGTVSATERAGGGASFRVYLPDS